MEVITLFVGIFFGILLFNAKRFMVFLIISVETMGVINLLYPELMMSNHKLWSIEAIVDSYDYYIPSILIAALFYAAFYWLIPKMVDSVLFNKASEADKFIEFAETGLPKKSLFYKLSKITGYTYRLFKKSKYLTISVNEIHIDELRYNVNQVLIFVLTFLLQLSIFFALIYMPIVSICFAAFSVILFFYMLRVPMITLFKDSLIDGFIDGFKEMKILSYRK